MIKFRLYSDGRRLIDLLSLYVPEGTELKEVEDGDIIIKLIFNDMEYNVSSLNFIDGRLSISRYRCIYPKDPIFTEKMKFIFDLVSKYEGLTYTEVIDNLINRVDDKI